MYMVIDLETQSHSSNKRKGNPFDPRNYIVLRAWKKQNDPACEYQYFKSKEEARANPLVIPDDVKLLVGHNIKFDLHHEMVNGSSSLRDFFLRGGQIWDTMYAEYLLCAMERSSHMVKLTDLAPKYGGTKKIDAVAALWDSGVLTSDIDCDLLLDYAIGTEEEGRNGGDVGNTEKIFLGQYVHAKDLGMRHSIRARMRGLCATTEMEFNGIKVDVRTAKEQLLRLRKELSKQEKVLEKYTHDIPAEVGFNWRSNVHVSCILFGGCIKYVKSAPYIDPATGELARKIAVAKWPLFSKVAVDPQECTLDENGVYHRDGVAQDTYVSGKKAGEPKFGNVKITGELKKKNQDFFFDLPGHTSPDGIEASAYKDGAGKPTYSVGKDTLAILSTRSVPFLKTFTNVKNMHKDMGTYYLATTTTAAGKVNKKGMLMCVNPDTHIVHHTLNHASTVTSRLASANPNMQNIPGKDKSTVKSLFVSRFGKDGVMVEADYSQLEVVGQALLIKDTQLIKDLLAGVDFHCKRLATKFKIPYEDALVYAKDEDNSPDYALWSLRRKNVKGFSFQRAYGAGAAAIAASTGMSLEDVEDLIQIEDNMYPGVKKFINKVTREIESTATSFADAANGYKLYSTGTYQAITGTIYSFRTYDAPEYLQKKGIRHNFKPTEIKNYPIQGTSGEIVQVVLGELWRYFISDPRIQGKAYLVNTVHDCIWADVHKDVVDIVVPKIIEIMQGVPAYLKKYFNIDCPVPFPVEAEIGPNMYNLKHYKKKETKHD